jgi:phage terminase large subunit GpA-like protein
MPSNAWPPKPGRPSIWCSHQCRRAAYEERRAAKNGAVAVRVEVVEKPVERVVERVRIEIRKVESTPAEAAQIVLRSPRACRTVLESLTAEADAGRLNTAMHAPTLRAAERLLASLRRARLIDG